MEQVWGAKQREFMNKKLTILSSEQICRTQFQNIPTQCNIKITATYPFLNEWIISKATKSKTSTDSNENQISEAE